MYGLDMMGEQFNLHPHLRPKQSINKMVPKSLDSARWVQYCVMVAVILRKIGLRFKPRVKRRSIGYSWWFWVV